MDEISAPPVLFGGSQLTVACALPGIADTYVGAEGTVTGAAEAAIYSKNTGDVLGEYSEAPLYVATIE